MKNGPASETGYTLVELIITVTILVIIAAIAVPAASTDSEKRLQEIAAEFAAAMRFARSESMRTGEPHGFRFLTNQYRIRVFTADTAANPWTWIWDVYHPVDKQLYDYTFPADLTPVTHTPAFHGGSACNRPGVIYFDENGTPWCLEPETVLLDSYQLNLSTAAGQATVRLDGITGRVTVQ